MIDEFIDDISANQLEYKIPVTRRKCKKCGAVNLCTVITN